MWWCWDVAVRGPAAPRQQSRSVGAGGGSHGVLNDHCQCISAVCGETQTNVPIHHSSPSEGCTAGEGYRSCAGVGMRVPAGSAARRHARTISARCARVLHGSQRPLPTHMPSQHMPRGQQHVSSACMVSPLICRPCKCRVASSTPPLPAWSPHSFAIPAHAAWPAARPLCLHAIPAHACPVPRLQAEAPGPFPSWSQAQHMHTA